MDNRYPKYKPTEKEWVYEQVATRLDNAVMPSVLDACIDEVMTDICNYINRGYVPDPLRFVVCNLTMDLLGSRAKNGEIENELLSNQPEGAVTELKDGDSDIKFSATAKNGVHRADVDAFLYNYKQQLDRFKTLRW